MSDIAIASFIVSIFVALVIFVLSGFRVAQEYQRGVVFRLGRYKATKGPGLYWNIRHGSPAPMKGPKTPLQIG